MLTRSLASIFIVVSSFVLVTGQTPDVKKEGADKTAKTAGGVQLEKSRDIPFPAGVDLQFLIKELAREMDLNVLFDPESRLENRKVKIELKNVTTADALNYVLLQEGLGFEEVGPKTILVAVRMRLGMIPQIGVGTARLEAAAAKTTSGTRLERLRDVPFANGVDLQFLLKELAADMDLNVLFDADSRLENRKVRIELKNVTAAEALNYVLLQEGLFSEEAGPKTILVAVRVRATSIPQIGVGTALLTLQLAQYFGVEGGVLINHVRRDSPGSKAGLKAGDVIVGIDDKTVDGPVGLMRAIDDKKESDFVLKIVRDRKDQTVSVRLDNVSR